MIVDRAHSLTFGDLTWIEEGTNPPDDSGVVYRVKAQDATFGTAVPLTTALIWLGRAGGPVSYDRTPNREPVFRVTVEADDSDLLARGEMALQLQCEQPTTLVWTPPDGAGEPSAFDIVWSHLEPVFDRDGLTGVGMEEALLRTRTYLVRMQALPYARTVDLVTTPALAVTPTYTLVDNGSALSGAGFSWAVTGTGLTVNGDFSVSVVSGRIRLTSAAFHSSFSQTFYRTGTVSLTPGRYVAVDMAFSNLVITSVLMDEGNSPLVATLDLGGGLTRYFFDAGWWGSSIPTWIRIRVNGTIPVTSSASYAEIDQVQLADSIPFIGTARQRPMSLVPGGSVRTAGSIHVTHASNSLGKVIVYTHPAGTGYLPPLRPWRTSSESVTSDSTLISGAWNFLSPNFTRYRVPVSALPEGRVELWAWLAATTGSGVGTLSWAISSWMGGAQLSYEVHTTDVNFAANNTWYLFPIGAATIPPVRLGPAGYIEVHLHEVSAAKGMLVDEAYLFATDKGSLTVVDCGTGSPAAGGPAKHLWIDAPTPEVPMGAVYRGTADDRSDAFHAGSAAYSPTWGLHEFAPRGASVFVVTQNTTNAATSLEHYKRFNTFVARED